MSKPEDLVAFQVRVPKELHVKLHERADKEGESAATIVRLALKAYLSE